MVDDGKGEQQQKRQSRAPVAVPAAHDPGGRRFLRKFSLGGRWNKKLTRRDLNGIEG